MTIHPCIYVAVAFSCITFLGTVFAESDLESKRSQSIIKMPLLHSDQVLARRRRERKLVSDGESEDIPIDEDEAAVVEYNTWASGQLFQGLGTHYVDLWVGSPAQRQTLIVDTGSDLTAFPCEPCPDCGHGYHIDNNYKDEESTTFHLMECEEGCELGSCKKLVGDDFSYCEVSLSYAEGSHWHAYEVTDQVYIGGPHANALENSRGLRGMQSKNTEDLENAFKKEATELQDEYKHSHPAANEFSFDLKFACQYKITGLFRTQLADGICGLENSKNSLWQQMYKAGKIKSKMFALCFSHSQDVDREGTKAGQMTLGGADTSLHTSPMVFAENYDKQGWYSVSISGIYLKYKNSQNETSTVKVEIDMGKMNRNGIIIDSGTTETFMPSILKDPFHSSFLEITGLKFNETVTNKEDLDSHPTILIQMQAAVKVEINELMDESDIPHENLAGSLDLDSANDVILEIPPENYLIYRKKSKKYTNAFHMTERSGFGILGANAMYGHDILFDTDKSRIGFAKSEC